MLLALMPAVAAAPAVYGYLPYWTVRAEDVPWEHLTHLAVFDVDARSDGTLGSIAFDDAEVAGLIAAGRAAGVEMHICVTNFDSDELSALLGSESRRATLVEALGALVDRHGFDGVNVDFEGVPGAQRDTLVAFTRALRARVPAVWLATPAVDWSDAFDYTALTASADGLFIMGYGYHWTGGDPGPNAPLAAGDLWGPWNLAWTLDDYRDAGADLSRVTLGLPLYGQGWPAVDPERVPTDAAGSGWSIAYDDATAAAAVHGRRWDEVSATAWYVDGNDQVWFDDSESIALKSRWALVDEGLGGIGFWAIGYDAGDPVLWAGVQAAVDEAAVPVDEEPAQDTAAPDPQDTDRGPPGRAQVVGESGCGVPTGVPAWVGVLAGFGALRARRLPGSTGGAR